MNHRYLVGASLGSLALLLTLGCDSPLAHHGDAPPAADFSLEMVPAKDRFSRGEEVKLQLENRSREDLGYGACSLLLERRTVWGWRLVGPEPTICIAILYVVRAGGTVDFEVELSNLSPGAYRYRMDLLPGTRLPETIIWSPEFAVLP